MRMGQFSKSNIIYGQSLDVVKPRDNNPGSVIPAALFDPSLNLTEAQRQELTDRINDLFRVYQGERGYFT